MLGLFTKHAQISIVAPRDIADDPTSLVLEAIETIVWKLPIVPVVWIVSKFFGQLGRSGKSGRSYENLVCYTAAVTVVTQISSPLTTAENRTTFLFCD